MKAESVAANMVESSWGIELDRDCISLRGLKSISGCRTLRRVFTSSL